MRTSAISARPDEHPSILVVDDNASIRILIALLLTEHGHVVESAADGASAIALAADRPSPFDLLVTDVQMPGTSGFELCESLAGDAVGPAVLFMSGSADHSRRVAPASTMVQGFIAKPFSATELLGAVDDLLTKRARQMAGDA